VSRKRQELKPNLKRRIGEQSYQLRFGDFLDRHEIDDSDRKRTYILPGRTTIQHYEYVFLLLKKMARIKDGKKMARDLVAAFRIRYKGRRVMMEILRRL
jgi:hypothetical protein